MERDNPRNIAQTSGYGKDRPFGRSFLSASSRSIGSLACSALGGRLSRALGCGGRSGRGGLHGSRGRTLGDGGGRLASCNLVKQGACHCPAHHSHIHILPPLPLPHTQAHEKAAMRTAREPMRTAAERKDCLKGGLGNLSPI